MAVRVSAPGGTKIRQKKHKGIKADDIIAFFQQLSTLLSAGTPLLRALQVSAHQSESEKFIVILRQLAGDVALSAGGSRIDLQGGVVGAGHDLTLSSSQAAADAIRTGAAIAGVDRLVVNGTSTLGGNVTTTGEQVYAGRTTLAADVTLQAGASRIDRHVTHPSSRWNSPMSTVTGS